MKVSRMLVVLGVLGGLLACTDDNGASDTTVATTVAATSTVPATTAAASTTLPEDLSKYLLTLDDVGSTWKLGHTVGEADFNDFGQLPCPDSAINPTIINRIRPTIGVQFEPSAEGARHLLQFVLTGESTRLAMDLEALIGAEQACADTTPSGSNSFKVERMTIPDLGEQRAAFVLRGLETNGSTSTWYVRQAVVRVGTVAITIGLTEILSSPDAAPSIPDTEFVRILTAATARLTN